MKKNIRIGGGGDSVQGGGTITKTNAIGWGLAIVVLIIALAWGANSFLFKAGDVEGETKGNTTETTDDG